MQLPVAVALVAWHWFGDRDHATHLCFPLCRVAPGHLPAWSIPNRQENCSFGGLFVAFCLAVWFDRLVSPTGESFPSVNCDGRVGGPNCSAPDWGKGNGRRAGPQRKARYSLPAAGNARRKMTPAGCLQRGHSQCRGRCWGEWSPSFGVSCRAVSHWWLLQRYLVPMGSVLQCWYHLLSGHWVQHHPWTKIYTNRPRKNNNNPSEEWPQVEKVSLLAGRRDELFLWPRGGRVKTVFNTQVTIQRARSPWVLMYRCSLKPYGSCSSFGSQDYK